MGSLLYPGELDLNGLHVLLHHVHQHLRIQRFQRLLNLPIRRRTQTPSLITIHINPLLGEHGRRKPRHRPLLPHALLRHVLAPAQHLPVAPRDAQQALAAPVPAARVGLGVDAVDRLAVRVLGGLVLDQVVEARAQVGLGGQELVGDADVARGAPHGQRRVRDGPRRRQEVERGRGDGETGPGLLGRVLGREVDGDVGRHGCGRAPLPGGGTTSCSVGSGRWSCDGKKLIA